MFLETKRPGGGGGGGHRPRHYILENHVPIPEDDILTWGLWFATADRHVAFTPVHYVHVSTVFLGLDHNYSEQGPPILFETMIFGGGEDGWIDRCATWKEAEQQHRLGMLVARVARRKPTARQLRVKALRDWRAIQRELRP